MSHELNNVWVVGSSDAAMAMAVNELRRLQGGWVLVRGNQVVATVPLEIGGLMSQRPATALAADFDHLDAEAEKMTWLGKPGIPNQLIFSFLTGTPWKWAVVAPSAKNPTGLVKVTTGETHAIVW
jgi:adenine deaminase